jgi:shikimate dehydrogenase
MKTPAAVRGSTRVTGIVGWPVAHSLSPAMHNAAYRALGLDYVYVPFAVRPEELASAVAGLRALQVAGVNVTLPHKVAVVALLDVVTREAELIGAVNTIVRRRDGHLEGHNTDGAGFLSALREEASLEPKGMRVTVVGAGGAGRAVAVSLALSGALSVTIVNRTLERAEALSAELSAKIRGATFRAAPLAAAPLRPSLAQTDLLVNCTAVGMGGEPFAPELPLGELPGHAIVFDLVYLTAATPLLEQARLTGRRRLGGLGMLARQGVLTQELWTGIRPPLAVLDEAARAALT